MTARFVMKINLETDENNKYSKASYQFVPQRGEYSQIYFKLVSWIQIEASKGCTNYEKKQYNSVENPHQIKGRLKSKIRKIDTNNVW
jgi:hypothetical protein